MLPQSGKKLTRDVADKTLEPAFSGLRKLARVLQTIYQVHDSNQEADKDRTFKNKSTGTFSPSRWCFSPASGGPPSPSLAPFFHQAPDSQHHL